MADADDESDADREAFDDWLGNEGDESSGPDEGCREQDGSREKSGDQETVVSILSDHACNDDDERARGAADLDPASSQQRNQQSTDDRRNQPRLGRSSGRDRNGNAERQGNQSDRDAGNRVADEQSPSITLKGRKELGLHWVPLGGDPGQFNELAPPILSLPLRCEHRVPALARRALPQLAQHRAERDVSVPDCGLLRPAPGEESS